MKQSDLNHLRRLLGWVRCDIGQAPAELQQTMVDVADGLGHPEISPEAKARMVDTYRRAESIPLYVRAAVKALEKTLAAGGREHGVESVQTAAETRASIGLDPGADTGREPALDDAQIEEGLAEIGVHMWGQRAEDWLAGAEYAARLLRGSQQTLAAKPLQNHLNAAADGVACRDIPAAPPARPHPAAPVGHETAGQPESCRSSTTQQASELNSAAHDHFESHREIDSADIRRIFDAEFDRPPVAGEAQPVDWQEALRISELPEVDRALETFCNDGTQDTAVGLVQAVLDAAPQASAEGMRLIGIDLSADGITDVRNAALEEAAAICEAKAFDTPRLDETASIVRGALACQADAIRALKSALAPQPANGDVALPPLPFPAPQYIRAEQMKEYARAAVLADRQQRDVDAANLARAMVKAHESLFAQCGSNPICNAWGKEVNVLALNQAYEMAHATLAAPKHNDGGAVYG